MTERPRQSGDQVVIFDTTLRDGVQDSAVNPTPEGSVWIAESLAEAGVDIIEVGFPVSSDGNFETAHYLARTLVKPVVAAFARTKPGDIERAWEAIEPAERGRLNVCAPVSDLHIQERLNMRRDELQELAVVSTAHAVSLTDNVQFSFEDFTRADPEFRRDTVLAVAGAGATTVMLPDTVGAVFPWEYAAMLREIRGELDGNGFEDVTIAAHCHNDMGQGTMNSLMALVFGGARQVDTTIGGVGERNGNLPLELVVGALAVRPDLGLWTNVDPVQLRYLSHVVLPRTTGVRVSEKQPFVGGTSYAHGSGMHVDGVLKNPKTFKDFNSAVFGFDKPFTFFINNQIGKAGVRHELNVLGIAVEDSSLPAITEAVKDLSNEQSRNLGHNELEQLAAKITGESVAEHIELEEFSFSGDTKGICEATVSIGGKTETVTSDGGVVDAGVKAINALTGFECRIGGWHGDDQEPDSNAVVGIFVTVLHNGYEVTTYGESRVSERASIAAYMAAVNIIMRAERRATQSEEKPEA